ncbi:MAG TPA: hypothetical protein VGG74_35605 [Kofleriaceae bacterium]
MAGGHADDVAARDFGAGTFAIVGLDGTITLLDPHSGATLATWAAPAGTVAAATFPHGVASVNLDGTVRIACVSGHTITQVAEARVGQVALGDRLVVSADGAEPIRVAKLPAICH